MSLPEESDRALVMRTPPGVLAEAGVHRLAKHDLPTAIRLAGEGMTQRELKEAVRAEEAGRQHLDSGELKTFRVVTSYVAYEKLMQVWHLMAFMCQSLPAPNNSGNRILRDSQIAEGLAEELTQSVQIDPAVLERFPLEMILQGRVRCVECGLTNPQDLESHHVVPRSHQGHEGPQVWLCRLCHAKVTQNVEGTWRHYLERWCARREMEWLKGLLEQWLGGRSLEVV